MRTERHDDDNLLTDANLALARQEARKFGSSDEWLSECYLVLVEAAASWDPALGVPFPVWARQLIRFRSRRRVKDQRVIRVPARIRRRFAELIDELNDSGRDFDSPTAVRYDQAMLSAFNALRPMPFGLIDSAVLATDEEYDKYDEYDTVTLPKVLHLRYGFDGFGIRTAREVAALTGLSADEVLRQDAAYILQRRQV